MPDLDVVRTTVGSIMERDPAFNLDTFLAEAQQAFWLVGQAHAKCDPELCAAVLAADIEERERASIAQTCANGTVKAPGPNDASTGQLVSLESDANRDTAIVHFRSAWRRVDGRDGDKNEEKRSQNWCFQRASSAKTSVVEEAERCHNCGASLQSSAGTCRYCGTRIGDDAGWRVIRIDDVAQEEAASAVNVMREAFAAMAAARGQTAPAPVHTAPPPRRSRVGTWVSRVFFIALILFGIGVYAALSDGGVHRTVAKVVPSIKFAQLKGPLDLNGRINASQVSASLDQQPLKHIASCDKAAVHTDFPFKAKLPDGSSFKLTLGLPPAAGGPGTYHRPQVSIQADAQNKSSAVSWSTNPQSTATMTIRPDGSGDVVFANLTSTTAGEGPIGGHLTWTCSKQ